MQRAAQPVPGTPPTGQRPEGRHAVGAGGGWTASSLSYCSNVHPGESLDELLATVGGPVSAVRERRGLERMASGLWIAAEAADTLLRSQGDFNRFAAALDDAGLTLQTLNGFPYGGFHAATVKAAVYRPDWSDPRRFDYTLALAGLLARLLPDDVGEGTISTVPLGDARGWSRARNDHAAAQLCRLASALADLAERTGRRVRVCLEPEPGCAMEYAAQAVHLFTRDLPAAADLLGTPREHIRNHLGICLDVCHQAVLFEDVAQTLTLLIAAGIGIGKIQLSSALEVRHPGNPETRSQLAAFAEPRWLHQVRAPGADGRLLAVDDLDLALADPLLATSAPWRIHFHVPIDSDLDGTRLTTTRAAIERTLAWLQINPACRPHLEVETYTWEVLPEGRRPETADALADGITGELRWVETALARRGLLVASP